MTVARERLVYELRGVACLDLETIAATQKECAVTRSFCSRVEDLPTMEQAVATHAARLGKKLRREGLGTDHVTVFFHTSEHDRRHPQRSISTVVSLPEATSDTLALIKACVHGVRKIWRGGYRYSKAGIITTDLVPLELSQRALADAFARERSGPLMEPMDACNRRLGARCRSTTPMQSKPPIR